MSCKCAKFDEDEGRYYCEVSGSQCMYLFPNSEQCAKDFGEGPDAEVKDNTENYKCKDMNCIHNYNGDCTRISDDGRYGICWMDSSEGEYQ